MKKILVSLILSYLFFIASHQITFAFTATSGDLQVTYNKPIFSSSTVWYPGMSESKFFTVKNLGESKHTVYLKSVNTNQTGNLSSVFYLKINEKDSEVYGKQNSKTVQNFWDEEEIKLTNLEPGDTATYNIVLSMSPLADNAYQGKSGVFDLVIGFGKTSQEVNMRNDETNNPITENINPASPSPISSLSELPVRFVQQVLGVSTPSAQITQGVILGEKKLKAQKDCTACVWWPILILEIIVVTLFYFFLREKTFIKSFVLGLFLPLGTNILFIIVNKCLSKNPFCVYFWLIDFFVYLLISLYFFKKYHK